MNSFKVSSTPSKTTRRNITKMPTYQTNSFHGILPYFVLPYIGLVIIVKQTAFAIRTTAAKANQYFRSQTSANGTRAGPSFRGKDNHFEDDSSDGESPWNPIGTEYCGRKFAWTPPGRKRRQRRHKSFYKRIRDGAYGILHITHIRRHKWTDPVFNEPLPSVPRKRSHRTTKRGINRSKETMSSRSTTAPSAFASTTQAQVPKHPLESIEKNFGVQETESPIAAANRLSTEIKLPSSQFDDHVDVPVETSSICSNPNCKCWSETYQIDSFSMDGFGDTPLNDNGPMDRPAAPYFGALEDAHESDSPSMEKHSSQQQAGSQFVPIGFDESGRELFVRSIARNEGRRDLLSPFSSSFGTVEKSNAGPDRRTYLNEMQHQSGDDYCPNDDRSLERASYTPSSDRSELSWSLRSIEEYMRTSKLKFVDDWDNSQDSDIEGSDTICEVDSNNDTSSDGYSSERVLEVNSDTIPSSYELTTEYNGAILIEDEEPVSVETYAFSSNSIMSSSQTDTEAVSPKMTMNGSSSANESSISEETEILPSVKRHAISCSRDIMEMASLVTEDRNSTDYYSEIRNHKLAGLENRPYVVAEDENMPVVLSMESISPDHASAHRDTKRTVGIYRERWNSFDLPLPAFPNGRDQHQRRLLPKFRTKFSKSIRSIIGPFQK